MRLIDADALKKEGWRLRRHVTGDGYAYEEVREIDQIPTIEARPAWISVKHLLPHAGQEVIAYSGNKMKPSVFATTFYAKTWAAWHTITHWMPLPEPPNCGADMRGDDDGK